MCMSVKILIFCVLDCKYYVRQDVLILSQFIRENGEVLPQDVTGLCYKAHLRLQRVVRQAQLAGLKL